jgi:hypothetical protein
MKLPRPPRRENGAESGFVAGPKPQINVWETSCEFGSKACRDSDTRRTSSGSPSSLTSGGITINLLFDAVAAPARSSDFTKAKTMPAGSSVQPREVTLKKADRTEVLALKRRDGPAGVADAPAAPRLVVPAAAGGNTSYAPFLPRSTPKNAQSDGL